MTDIVIRSVEGYPQTLKDLGDGTYAELIATKDTNGEGAVTYITNTTPVTGLNARQVICLTDTVFATFTRTGATGSITGITLPAGTLLIGPVTAITLTSGAVAAYA